MFDIDELLKLGIFNQLIPVWQILFFIASLLPFLLWNRVKICLLITYLFTFYLGFMIIFGEHLAKAGSMLGSAGVIVMETGAQFSDPAFFLGSRATAE